MAFSSLQLLLFMFCLYAVLSKMFQGFTLTRKFPSSIYGHSCCILSLRESKESSRMPTLIMLWKTLINVT